MSRPPQLPTTLLVDLPNWVGDQMMAMPALSRLVEGNRGGETVLHTRPAMVRFLLAAFPETSVVASPRKYSPLLSARDLRQGDRRFEIGVTLRNSARGKILVRFGARWCAGSRGEGARVLLSAPCRVDRDLHQAHDADSLLGALGLEAANPLWRLELPGGVIDEGKTAMRRIGVEGQRVIGLAPATARGETTRWPVRYYGELATRLRARGLEPVIVVGPGEGVIADELCRSARLELPLVGENLDIAGLAGTIAGFRMLVGNDSGPMQLAACLGTSVVAIFGPTDPNRTAPRGFGHRVVSTNTGRKDRMRDISVGEVEAATVDLFNSANEERMLH